MNAFRRDDLRPHIYKTHDGGRTWTHIVSGIRDRSPVNVVREDSRQRGLLFAGTEREVSIGLASEVELVRPLEPLRIAVGAAVQEPHHVAARELHAAMLKVLEHEAVKELQRRVVAEQFLDRGGDQGGLVSQSCHLRGIAQEREQAVAGAVDRRLVPGIEQQHAGRDELIAR